MKTSGIEELQAALKRSVWLIVALVVLNVGIMNAIRQLNGPEYRATARVLLNNSDVSSAIANISVPYVDPGRKDQAEQNLANSQQLYAFVAQRMGGTLGSGPELEATTSATVANNVVTFSTVTSDQNRTMRIVNAVATAYPSWRAEVSNRSIDAAISELKDELARSGSTPDLQGRLQQLQILKSLSSGDTLFVESAGRAEKTTPKPLKDSILGVAMGLIIALLVVGVREIFDTRIRSESDVEDLLKVPVLGTIESLPRQLRTKVLSASGNRYADAYELLAANVAHVVGDQSETAYIAVTSAMPGEGKTTTAANLAAGLARRGARVVLADFDLRKPSVSEFFPIPRNAAGVQELLSGHTPVGSVLWHVQLNGDGSDGAPPLDDEPVGARAQQTTAARQRVNSGSLVVVPGGGGTSHPTSTSFSRLPGVLDKLEFDADFVVIDTPPALLGPAVAELEQSMDAIVVVVRQGAITRRRLRALSRQAQSWRGKLIGAVFNDAVREEANGYGYYGRG